MPEKGEGEVREGYVGLYPAGDPVIYRADGEVVLVHPEGFLDTPQAPVMGEDVLRFRGAFRRQVGDDSVKAVPPAVPEDLFFVQDVAVLSVFVFKGEVFVRSPVGDEAFSRKSLLPLQFPAVGQEAVAGRRRPSGHAVHSR